MASTTIISPLGFLASGDMDTPTTPALSADDIDDLLYLTRVNESADLQQTISDLAKRYQCSPRDIVTAGIDSESGNSVLHYACANGFLDLVRLFLAQSTTVPNGIRPHLNQLRLQLFINERNAEGNTALHWAAYNGHVDIVRALIDSGAGMWIKNAAGHYAMFEAERAERNDVVQYLLEKGGETVERGTSGAQSVSEDVEDVDDVDVSMEAEASNSSSANPNDVV